MNQHVVRSGDKWSVRGEGNSKLTSVRVRQSDAIEAARDIVRNQQSELLIHDRKNQIRKRDSYGNAE